MSDLRLTRLPVRGWAVRGAAVGVERRPGGWTILSGERWAERVGLHGVIFPRRSDALRALAAAAALEPMPATRPERLVRVGPRRYRTPDGVLEVIARDSLVTVFDEHGRKRRVPTPWWIQDAQTQRWLAHCHSLSQAIDHKLAWAREHRAARAAREAT